MRRVLIEAAWVAVNTHPYWKEQFQRLCRRKHPNQAITAIARRLLVAVWHILTERAADCHAEPEMVAFPGLSASLSWTDSPGDRQIDDLVVPACRQTGKLSDTERGGLTSRQPVLADRPGFVRYGLLQLNLGHDLTHIVTGKATRRAIAPPDEVLALRPELGPAA